MKVVVVIPTYNEAENIGILLEQIFSLMISNLRVVVVDDSSPDGTAHIVKTLKTRFADLELINRPKKLGLGSAYIVGFRKALNLGADLICEMDADGSHEPKDLFKMINVMINSNEPPFGSPLGKGGIDLVIGSRHVQGGQIIGWHLGRHLTSRLAIGLSRLVLGLKTQDVTSGFRCYQRKVLEQVNLDQVRSNGYAFQEETLYLAEKDGFKVKEIPITFIDRQRGKSKLSFGDVVEFFLTLVRLKNKA